MPVYDSGLLEFNTWDTETYEWMILRDTYLFDRTHAVVADVVAYELTRSGYVRDPVTGAVTVFNPATGQHRWEYQADNPNLGSPVPGGQFQWLVLYRFVTDDSDSVLVGAYQLSVAAIPTDGRPLIVRLRNGLAGYLKNVIES